MKRLWPQLRALVKRAPKPRTLALDVLAMGGAAGAVHGVYLMHAPSAWILGGFGALTVAILLQRGGEG